MAKVIIFSREYPAYHPKKKQPTWFVEKLLKSFDSEELIKKIFDHKSEFKGISYAEYEKAEPKHHTVRLGRNWKAGQYFSPRVWSGKPYYDPTITIGSDTLITHTYDLTIYKEPQYVSKVKTKSHIEFKSIGDFQWLFDDHLEIIAKNDGLSLQDFKDWILPPVMKGKPFLVEAQIICWNKAVDYDNNPDWMPF